MRDTAIFMLIVFIVMFFLAGGWYAMQYVNEMKENEVYTATTILADMGLIWMRVLAATSISCGVMFISLVIAHTKKLL